MNEGKRSYKFGMNMKIRVREFDKAL